MQKVLEVAVYKGEELLVSGTLDQCARHLKVDRETIRYYLSPTYHRRVSRRRSPDNSTIAVRLEEDDE